MYQNVQVNEDWYQFQERCRWHDTDHRIEYCTRGSSFCKFTCAEFNCPRLKKHTFQEAVAKQEAIIL